MNGHAMELTCTGRRPIKGSGSVCILVCAGVVAILMGLVALRLYSLNMEYKLAEIQRQIVTREEEQSRLEKDLASLLNPTRVYSYARSELGMRASANIGLVKVAGPRDIVLADNGKASPGTGKLREVLARLVDTITGKASARQ
ncbi:MAG: hypothetical protein Q7I97_04460 [Thermovirgaceae bacterium]|nr:hypothetical protein [Thermovirgaceae bacterium]